MNMKRIVLSCVGLLVSVAVLAGVGPTGLAAAGELADSTTHSETSPENRWRNRVVGVNFHAGYRLSLGKPKTITNEHTAGFHQLLDVGGTGAGYGGTMRESHFSTDRSVVAVSWPILQGLSRLDTGYTVTSYIRGWTYERSLPWEDGCYIDGPGGRNAGPFHCYQVERGWLSFHFDLYITDDRVDRLAEASGSITTDDSVSLINNGGYPTYTESKLQLAAAATVPVESSTQFDAVLTQEDVDKGMTGEPNTALITFVYAVYDGGKPVYSTIDGRQLFVKGYVSNKRTGTFFAGGSWCEFVTEGKRIDEISGYSCEPSGDYADTEIKHGHVHYITDFTVSKKHQR